MNILISSVGRRSYIVEYFKKKIKKSGKVFVSNSTNLTPAFQVSDGYVVTPLIYSKNYIPFLLDYCKKNNIKIIISLFDIDLYILAINKTKFEKIGTKVIVSDAEFIKKCNDKWQTYNYLSENLFCVPKTYLSIADVKNDINKKIINYPVILKPRWGMGSLSIYEADNNMELDLLYNKIKKEIQKSYIKYESKQDMDNCVIIQEKITGDEYGIDIINDLNGNYINTICKRKIAMRAGETDCAEIIINNNLESIGKKLGLLSQHVANLDVDIIKHNSKYYILEMNARIGGGYPFSHLAGVDLPSAIIDWSLGKKVDKDILTINKCLIAHKDINIKEL